MSWTWSDHKMLTACFDGDGLARTVRNALRAEYGDLNCATKRIATAMDADPRAVRNWWEGISAPRTAQFVKLMKICPTLRQWFLEHLAAQDEKLRGEKQDVMSELEQLREMQIDMGNRLRAIEAMAAR